MANFDIPDSICRDAYDAAKAYRSVAGAARATGVPRTTFDHRVKVAMMRFSLPHPAAIVVDAPAFTAYAPKSKARPLDEIIAHRLAESDRAADYESANEILRIDIKTPGPVGLMIFGDPHIDNPGCDFSLLKSHLEIAASRSGYVYAGNIGDLQDNWIGRLERLYADTTINAKEIWALVEWMMKGAGVRWTWLARGNHDLWCGRNDPLDWIAKSAGVGIDKGWAARIGFHHPNGTVTRMNAAHDFPGNSQFNPLHALKREVLHGFRDHIIIAGHRHIGASATDVNGDGMPFVMVRASGYKISDFYRVEKGLKARPVHPAAFIVVDPDEPDKSPNRVWVAPSVEVGAYVLDQLRNRYEQRGEHERAKNRIVGRSKGQAVGGRGRPVRGRSRR